MSNIDFQVRNARHGTEAQKAKGIMATFSLRITVDGTAVVELMDAMVRQTKGGGAFVASPYRSYEKDGETKHISFYRIFPDDKSNSFQAKIIDQVRENCNNPAPAKKAATGKPATTPKPQSW